MMIIKKVIYYSGTLGKKVTSLEELVNLAEQKRAVATSRDGGKTAINVFPASTMLYRQAKDAYGLLQTGTLYEYINMSKKCRKCIGKVSAESDREVCDHCFAVACCVNSKELYEELESTAESLNEAIEMQGDKVDKDTLHGWQAARDDAWNLLRRLEK